MAEDDEGRPAHDKFRIRVRVKGRDRVRVRDRDRVILNADRLNSS